MNTVLAKKNNTAQIFVGDLRVPVTYIDVMPSVVTQIKNADTDGYWAVQLGFDNRRAKLTTKPLQGHLKNNTENKNSKPKNYPRYLKEVRLDCKPEYKVGDEVSAFTIFSKGDVVSVCGVSKGKGFAGGVKRWGFAGGPKTHGQSDRTRAPGSIGAGTTPGRVYKGKKMAGRMGNQGITIKNLHIISMDQEKNQIAVSGLLPGHPGTLFIINKLSSGSLKDLEKEAVTQIVEEEVLENSETKEGGTQ